MSYSNATSRESESLIEACLERVRLEARLDDDPVLPRLPPRPSPPPAFVRTAEPIVVPARVPEDLEVPSRPSRWPVLAWFFLVGVFGGAALMKSPVAKKPAVQHTLHAAGDLTKRVYVAVKHRL